MIKNFNKTCKIISVFILSVIFIIMSLIFEYFFDFDEYPMWIIRMGTWMKINNLSIVIGIYLPVFIWILSSKARQLLYKVLKIVFLFELLCLYIICSIVLPTKTEEAFNYKMLSKLTLYDMSEWIITKADTDIKEIIEYSNEGPDENTYVRRSQKNGQIETITTNLRTTALGDKSDNNKSTVKFVYEYVSLSAKEASYDLILVKIDDNFDDNANDIYLIYDNNKLVYYSKVNYYNNSFFTETAETITIFDNEFDNKIITLGDAYNAMSDELLEKYSK